MFSITDSDLLWICFWFYAKFVPLGCVVLRAYLGHTVRRTHRHTDNYSITYKIAVKLIVMSVKIVLFEDCDSNTGAAICALGGRYTVQLKSGLRLVMLNSNLWYSRDLKMANVTDPAEQFKWLENILKDAKEWNNLVSFHQIS